MRSIHSLRVLSLLGFLLLMAPFYDACSERKGERKGLFVKSYDLFNVDGTPVIKSFSEKVYEVVVDELSFSGFEIASLSYDGFQDVTFKELKNELQKALQEKDLYRNLGIIISFIFDFIFLFSFSMIVLSFTKKMKFLNKLALTNSILILITLLYIIILESSFEHWSQIKWGYYAFTMVQILIFVLSKKIVKQNQLDSLE